MSSNHRRHVRTILISLRISKYTCWFKIESAWLYIYIYIYRLNRYFYQTGVISDRRFKYESKLPPKLYTLKLLRLIETFALNIFKNNVCQRFDSATVTTSFNWAQAVTLLWRFCLFTRSLLSDHEKTLVTEQARWQLPYVREINIGSQYFYLRDYVFISEFFGLFVSRITRML